MDLSYAEYVTCYPSDKTADEYCPITSFSFDRNAVEQTDRILYNEVQLLKGGVAVPNRSIYYSKQVVQHAIDVIRVSGGAPCEDELDISVHPWQSFHFTELARPVSKCRNAELSFQFLPTPSDFKLSEYEF